MNKDTEEPTYTLAEARRVMALRECAAHGHSWSIIQSMAGPVKISCEVCGWSGSVTMDERSAR